MTELEAERLQHEQTRKVLRATATECAAAQVKVAELEEFIRAVFAVVTKDVGANVAMVLRAKAKKWCTRGQSSSRKKTVCRSKR